MDSLSLAGKVKVQAHGRQLVLTKKAGEKPSHVWLKAGLWYLYLPRYPDIQVELSIGHRFKPDVIALATATLQQANPAPLFWGECGQITPSKLEKLFHQYPSTHFVIAKWEHATNWEALLDGLLSDSKKPPGQSRRGAKKVELLCFPSDTPQLLVESRLRLEDVLVRRWTT